MSPAAATALIDETRQSVDLLGALRATRALAAEMPRGYFQQDDAANFYARAYELLTQHGDALESALKRADQFTLPDACERKRARLASHGYQVVGVVMGAKSPDEPCVVIDGDHVSWHIRPIAPSAGGEAIGEWGIWLESLTDEDSAGIFDQHPDLKDRLVLALRQANQRTTAGRAFSQGELEPVRVALNELVPALQKMRASHPMSPFNFVDLSRLLGRVEDALAVFSGR